MRFFFYFEYTRGRVGWYGGGSVRKRPWVRVLLFTLKKKKNILQDVFSKFGTYYRRDACISENNFSKFGREVVFHKMSENILHRKMFSVTFVQPNTGN